MLMPAARNWEGGSYDSSTSGIQRFATSRWHPATWRSDDLKRARARPSANYDDHRADRIPYSDQKHYISLPRSGY